MSLENNHEKIPIYIVQKDNRYSVKCQINRVADCLEIGEFCDSQEEALEWVEEECWIFSGEGWICYACVEGIWKKVVNKRQEKEDDRWKG